MARIGEVMGIMVGGDIRDESGDVLNHGSQFTSHFF